MKPTHRIRVHVLCEDSSHKSFIHAYLKLRGFHPRKLFFADLPEGRGGSGEKWVRDHFPREVRCYRKYRRDNVILIVMIDVDNGTPQGRIAQLETALRDDDQKPRPQDDRIAILTPAWCLENWFWFLNEDEIIENETKKHTYTRNGSFLKDHKPSAFAAKMFDWCQSDGQNAPSSLKTSCTEWRRLRID